MKRFATPAALLALSGCIVTPEGERAINRAVNDVSSAFYFVLVIGFAVVILLIAGESAAK